MNNYEAMFIVRPDLSEENLNSLLKQIQDVIIKIQGTVSDAEIWANKRRLSYRIKGCDEGTYLLVRFNIAPGLITTLKQNHRLNEDILRLQILKR